MDFLTADLIDHYGDTVQTCELQFRQFGGRLRFHGPIRTVQTFEDNLLIRQSLSQPVDGAVLVVDGNASPRCALLGDQIGALALHNGWAGIVIHGMVRDSVALASLNLGIKALGTNPRKSNKTGAGRLELDVPVTFGGATFRPGEWLYSDEDGIVVSSTQLSNL